MANNNEVVRTSKFLGSDWRTSKMGYRFDVFSDNWRLDGSCKVSMNWAETLAVGDVASGLRPALAQYAEECAAGSVVTAISNLKAYGRLNKKLVFTPEGLLEFKNKVSHGEQRLGGLRSFLFAWAEWRFPGVDKSTVKFLEELTLCGWEKGKAVKTRCPYSGPLTAIEQGALVQWMSNAFVENVISLRQYTLLMALMLTGRRSVQLRRLRAEDLFSREDGSGSDYILRVPRAKQRGEGYRTAFRSLPIEEDLYLLLDNLAKTVRRRVERVLGRKIPQKLARKLPIFFQEERMDGLKSFHDMERLLSDMPDYFDLTNSGLAYEMHWINVVNQAKSERTGDFIHITAGRFRRTKATNLNNRGITGAALAYALDHSDTQQISVYTENTAASAKYIDDIMSPVLAPLAQAFAGQLIDSERDACRANDPHSRIKNSGSNGVGNCGTHAFCASGYRACYTCVNFQPWINAPHHEVKEEVLVERERQRELDISPAVIGATDRLLLAVEEVIRLCSEAKKQEIIDG